jgi:hypothetical protein
MVSAQARGRVGFLMVLLLGGMTRAEAPKVATSVPKDGDRKVDPATTEIRVVFDQAMDEGGFSWVGSGEAFPEVTDKPRWLNNKTCVLPVRLKPNHEYKLSINSDQFQNFRGANGEAAVPFPLTFKTAPAKAAKPLTPAENRKAFDNLRRAIDQDYSYRDRHGIDWAAAFARAEPKLIAAHTADEFAQEAAALLAPAKDLHLWLKVDSSEVPTHRRRVAPNCSLAHLEKTVPAWTQKSSAVYAGKFDQGVAYIMITTWGPADPKALDAAYEMLWEAAGARALIVDVRLNSGGSETLAQEFAGCFLDAPKVYAKHTVRRGGNFSEVREREVEPNKVRPRFRGRVAVLMGPANMSSCESFLLMMKQVPGCQLIGQRSYGSSGNPRPVDLGNGVTAFVPSWRDFLPDGTEIEGKGIAPDIEVKATARQFADDDPVLKAALMFMHKP